MMDRSSRPHVDVFDPCPRTGAPCIQIDAIAALGEGLESLRAEGREERATILTAIRGDGTEANPGMVIHLREIRTWIAAEERRREAEAEARKERKRAIRSWGLGILAMVIASITGVAVDHFKPHPAAVTQQKGSP